MRTNIIIDDTLMSDVLKITGVKSKREAVELGLKTLLMLNSKNLLKPLKVNYIGMVILKQCESIIDSGRF